MLLLCLLLSGQVHRGECMTPMTTVRFAADNLNEVFYCLWIPTGSKQELVLSAKQYRL